MTGINGSQGGNLMNNNDFNMFLNQFKDKKKKDMKLIQTNFTRSLNLVKLSKSKEKLGNKIKKKTKEIQKF